MQTFACTKGVARKAYASSEILFFEEFEIEFLSERSIGNFYFATQSFTNDCRNEIDYCEIGFARETQFLKLFDLRRSKV